MVEEVGEARRGQVIGHVLRFQSNGIEEFNSFITHLSIGMNDVFEEEQNMMLLLSDAK